MCEIAVYPGSSNSDEQKALAQTLYSENPDGLGMVAVYDEVDRFDYSVHKSEEPDFEAVRGFLNAHSDAWRIITHARLATAGGTGYQETHPIEPRCEQCDIDYIIHNGGVYNHRSQKRGLKRMGHDFTTSVDSEVIGHRHGEVPDSLDDFKEPRLAGSLNYLLLSEDGILIRNSGKYRVSYDMKMSCGYRNWQNRDDCESGYALFKPDRSVEKIDMDDVAGVRNESSPWGSGAYRTSGSTRTTQTTVSSTDDSEDSVEAESNRGPDTGNRCSASSPCSGTERGTPSSETEEWFRAKGWEFCQFHERFYSEQCPDCIEEAQIRPPSEYNGPGRGRY